MKLIRHNLSGVWFGEFSREGDEWVGKGKRLRRWYGPSDVSGVAAGATLKTGTYATPEIASVCLTVEQTCEVLTCSEKGAANLNAVEVRDVP